MKWQTVGCWRSDAPRLLCSVNNWTETTAPLFIQLNKSCVDESRCVNDRLARWIYISWTILQNLPPAWFCTFVWKWCSPNHRLIALLRVTSYLPSVHWMLRTSYWSRKRWSVWCRVKPSTLSFKLHPLMEAWSVCLAPMFLSGFIIFLPSPINRENRRGHRSPSIHYPECKRRRCAGPAASSRVRPAHGAARQQARTVPKTDGKAGVPTRRAATSPSLSGQEVQTIWMKMSKKSGGEVRVWKRLGVSQIRVGGRGYIT